MWIATEVIEKKEKRNKGKACKHSKQKNLKNTPFWKKTYLKR